MKRHLVVQTLRPVPGLSEATQTTISILQINPSVARAAEKQYFTAAHGRKRDSHDGYISPSPVTPEHSPLWSSAPKAPKSIVAVLQNRAVTICLHRDRGQTQSYVSLPACLFFFCFLFFPFFLSFFLFFCLKGWMDVQIDRFLLPFCISRSGYSSLLCTHSDPCGSRLMCCLCLDSAEAVRSVLNVASHWAPH